MMVFACARLPGILLKNYRDEDIETWAAWVCPSGKSFSDLILQCQSQL